jgi:hypothetical protein
MWSIWERLLPGNPSDAEPIQFKITLSGEPPGLQASGHFFGSALSLRTAVLWTLYVYSIKLKRPSEPLAPGGAQRSCTSARALSA